MQASKLLAESMPGVPGNEQVGTFKSKEKKEQIQGLGRRQKLVGPKIRRVTFGSSPFQNGKARPQVQMPHVLPATPIPSMAPPPDLRDHVSCHGWTMTSVKRAKTPGHRHNTEWYRSLYLDLS